MASPFLESLRADMRLRGYSLKTEKSYLEWIRQYIYFIGKRHPSDAGAEEVKAFLTHLAVSRNVAINTQKVALNAVVYLYHKFFNRELGDLGFKLATKQRHLPCVLSVREVGLILARLSGRNRLIIELLYGSGLRVNECLRLRVQDVDLERLCLTIHDGKGRKDRQTLLAAHIPMTERCVGITCMILSCADFWLSPCVRPGCLTRRSALTLSDIRSPRTCWPRGRTSAPFRNYSGTTT